MADIEVIPITHVKYKHYVGNGSEITIKTKYKPTFVKILRNEYTTDSGTIKSEWHYVFQDGTNIKEVMDNGQSFIVQTTSDITFEENKIKLRGSFNIEGVDYFIIIYTQRNIETFVKIR